MAYIQRKNMDKHKKTCSKRDEKHQHDSFKGDVISERLSSIEENLTFLRKSLNEEIRMRHDMIVELGHFKKRNQVS